RRPGRPALHGAALVRDDALGRLCRRLQGRHAGGRRVDRLAQNHVMDFLRPALGLAPVLCFLGALVLLDSYKLVRLRAVVAAVVAGMLVAGLAYLLNGWLLEWFEFHFYTRYVSPVLEEALKALIIVALIRAHR